MLTSTEQALVRAAGNGNLLDLTTGDPVRDDPAKGMGTPPPGPG